jgi:hypothetical protein
MKRIITTPLPESILVKDLPEFPFIGVTNSLGEKTFLIMTEYRNPDSYKMFAPNGISNGNSYYNFSGNLRGNLQNALIDSSFKYFLFESEKELFKWLSEE